MEHSLTRDRWLPKIKCKELRSPIPVKFFLVFGCWPLDRNDRLRIIPIQPVIASRQMVCLGVKISGRARLLCPFSQRKQEFSKHKVAHVSGPIRQAVLRIVQSVQVPPPVRFSNPRKPRFVPNGRGILKCSIALVPNLCRNIQGRVDGTNGLRRLPPLPRALLQTSAVC